MAEIQRRDSRETNIQQMDSQDTNIQYRDSEETNIQQGDIQETNVTAIEIPVVEIDGAEITSWVQLKTWLEETKECFNWDDFFFALIFGLAPTAWDMYTDLKLAAHLHETENAHAAGLCYVFICLPGINLVKEQVGLDYDIQQDHLGMNIAPMFNHSF